MTETMESTAPEPNAPKKRGGLGGMLLADLKAMANGMGIAGANSMKKAQLIDAIKAAQGNRAQSAPAQKAEKPAVEKPAVEKPAVEKPATEKAQKPVEKPVVEKPAAEKPAAKTAEKQPAEKPAEKAEKPAEKSAEAADAGNEGGQRPRRQRNQSQNKTGGQGGQGGQPAGGQGKGPAKSGQPAAERKNEEAQKEKPAEQADDSGDDDGEGGSRRNRRRRGRDRDRNRPGRGEPDTTVLEDDVLVPAAGILDVLDNYAFVRTSGYLPGPDDVYLSLSLVKRLGLRRGDAIVGQVRQPREGERKEKYNPMVRIDSVNGADPEVAKHRVEFDKLAPVHPDQRLRLEGGTDPVTGRIIDLVSPIGKGQRGLISAPSKAGKTTVLQAIAGAITANNPECHLMVVLVDERPEEVTDFERSVKGEVIASTFDRQPADHTVVAELAIERAKRLVELGHDVVVLLDGLTRLGKAYNLSVPASGRILGGGVDSAALYPTKRFFGAARNVEDGGSLTILATAAVETGSKTDEIIFEAFKDTANSELRLSEAYAEAGIFPAVDVNASGTRRDDLLFTGGEGDAVRKLRASLATLEGAKAASVLVDKVAGSATNMVLLNGVAKS
ncbi:transcription termination factor Rho [Nocardioides sp.]|uniref:transcription termination factor Rho n=1 Tax=Nocardioides sp. TaxID=35761 RepID=UPI001998E68E|nr:transcription termination factor Rho [Nocardioides sp.]MBC7277848.1 transcription termination factor Rho [Nocardioides sp.]